MCSTLEKVLICFTDPHEIELYEQYSEFLAQLNNESKLESFQYPQSWKANFERLENLVLIGGPDDGVITPWQSAHFECYDCNETVVPLKYSKVIIFLTELLANRVGLSVFCHALSGFC